MPGMAAPVNRMTGSNAVVYASHAGEHIVSHEKQDEQNDHCEVRESPWHVRCNAIGEPLHEANTVEPITEGD